MKLHFLCLLGFVCVVLSGFAPLWNYEVASVVGERKNNELVFQFEVPCFGCLDAHAQIFNISIHHNSLPCEPRGISVNNVPLDWSEASARGEGTLSGHGSHRRLDATWQTACQYNKLLLSFQESRSIGFTILFTQDGRPDVFRLFRQPLSLDDLAVSELEHSRSLVILDRSDKPLQDAFAELQSREHEYQLVRQKYIQSEKTIADVKTRICSLSAHVEFCSSQRKCHTYNCFLVRIWRKLSSIISSILLYFRETWQWEPEVLRFQGDPPEAERHRYDEPGDVSEAYSHDELGDVFDTDRSTVKTTPTPVDHKPSARPTRDVQVSPTPKLTFAHPQNVTRSHDPTPHFHSLQPLDRFLILVALLPLLGTIVFAVIFRLMVRRRAQKSRAVLGVGIVAHEQIRTTRTKSSARTKWRKWWRQRNLEPTNDYEEKRALVLEQEGVLDGAMQAEIRQVTSAEQIAHDLAPAADRTQFNTGQVPFRSEQATLRRTDSLPSYRRNSDASSRSAASGNPPPQYDQEFDGDLDVVDGFTYSQLYGQVNSHRFESDGFAESVDTSPDSSVVDCSPRMSFETGRTALSTKGRDQEEHNTG